MATPYPTVGPPVSSTPSSKVELHISCKNLVDTDVFSKSDPIVAIYTVDNGGKAVEYARTECIQNNLNPEFSKAIEMVYRFEEVQKLKFTVYDIDNVSPTLDDDAFLGSIECTLGEVVSASTFTKPLESGGKKIGSSTITIRAEELSQNNSKIDIKFSAVGLDKKDFLGKSDPYLEFAKENPDGSFTSVHRTEYIKNTLNPVWPPFAITSQALCSGDPDRKIKVTCFDWDSDGSHDLIGEFTTSLAELSGGSVKSWPCINPKKLSKKKYTNSGTVRLEKITETKMYSFLEYIMGGCQINFTVGVDFTGSNGNPLNPSSLHFIDPAYPNQYTQALIAVGAVCQDYDSDKLFPALGFGGKIGGNVSFEFPLNGNPSNPYCLGVQGVIQAYHQALTTVELWGPTNFAPIIRHVANFAEQATRNPEVQQYFILLMLTDGAISDMMATKQAVIAASHLPMSIIIVGVGEANFDAMNELDSDDTKLTVGSSVASRDIVQFVPFRDFKHSSPQALAAAVLAEVPSQLVEYMTEHRLTPMNRTQ
ncbi:copine-1-like [Halichondria panicea]|uniref:copine-1-like n=1 Tax=Halichondria panicea TaxID=6063 RepID=UPI00312B766B